MLRKTLTFLFITLIACIAFADDYTAKIDSAVIRFSSSDHRILKLAMHELSSLPREADDALITKFKNGTTYEKIVLIEVFAIRQQLSACQNIVEMIEFLPESAAPRIAAALDKIGDTGWQTLVKYIKEKNNQGISRTPKLEKVYQLLVRERILNFYIERVESRRFAYYREEFSEIFKFGKIALDVLNDLILNKDNILGNFPIDKTDKIREFIVRSLGDSGLPESKKIIEKAQSMFQEARYSYYYRDISSEITFSDVCALSLFNLGETKLADKIVENAKADLIKLQGLRYFDHQFYIANMYLMIHKLDEAESVYNETIQTIDSKEDNKSFERKRAYAYYKLAVIAGIRAQNEKDEEEKDSLRRKCMQNLKSAFRAGFNDFSRMFLDKNIQILWETGEFNKWIEKLRADEQLKELIPKWKPGKPTKLTQEERDKTPEEDSFDPFPE